MTHTHPKLDPPDTNDRGSRPIDAILTLKILQNYIRTGWLLFGSGIGYHHIRFIDIKMNTFIGKEKNKITTLKARRLHTTHVKSMNKYLTQVEKEYKNHNLVQQLQLLYKQYHNNNPVDTKKY